MPNVCSNLLKPISIGTVTVKNRVAMAPMVVNYADRGYVTEQVKAFYGARARGGFGLIVAGALTVTEILSKRRDSAVLRLVDSSHRPGLAALAEVVHYFGAKVFMQLSTGQGPGGTRAGRQLHLDPSLEPITASAVSLAVNPDDLPREARKWHERKGFEPFSVPLGETPREATIDEIEIILDGIAASAQTLKELGYDGVELHSAHGGFAYTFLSPVWNVRTDAYGGSPENRQRFLREMIQRTRQAVGGDFAVGVRVSLEGHAQGEVTLDDTKGISREMEAMGANYIHLSDGSCHFTRYTLPDEDGTMLAGAEEIRRSVNIPVITPSVHDPDMADVAIEQRKTDLISLGRQAIADPAWPNKVASGRRPVKCLRCNLGCWDLRLMKGLPVRCELNRAAGFEQYDPANLPAPPFKKAWAPLYSKHGP